MGGDGYAREGVAALYSALWDAQVRSKAIHARSEKPRRWPSEGCVASAGWFLDSMDGALL